MSSSKVFLHRCEGVLLNGTGAGQTGKTRRGTVGVPSNGARIRGDLLLVSPAPRERRRGSGTFPRSKEHRSGFRSEPGGVFDENGDRSSVVRGALGLLILERDEFLFLQVCFHFVQ